MFLTLHVNLSVHEFFFVSDSNSASQNICQFFSGIHFDQTIEQTLMKSMSTDGGVTDSVVYQRINSVFLQD